MTTAMRQIAILIRMKVNRSMVLALENWHAPFPCALKASKHF